MGGDKHDKTPLEDDVTIEVGAPPKARSMLVFQKTMSAEMISGIARTLKQAIEGNEWPIVLAGTGPVKWYSIDEMPRDHPVEKIRVYKDRAGEWRWVAYAANQKKIADSGEGYHNFDDCADMAERLFPGRPVDMRQYIYMEIEG